MNLARPARPSSILPLARLVAWAVATLLCPALVIAQSTVSDPHEPPRKSAGARDPPRDSARDQGGPREAESPRVWLNAGFLSYHFERDLNLRERNGGVGVEVALQPDHRVIAGTYLNSNDHRSRYIGWTWQPLRRGRVALGATLAAIDGYPTMRQGGWYLAAVPVVSVEVGALGVNFTLVPDYRDRLHGAIVAQFKLRVW